MNYYLDIFSPTTYEVFAKTEKAISGFNQKHENKARLIHSGDKLICYMSRFCRFVGILEITSDYFIDDSPIYLDPDPFVVRFGVKPLAWLEPHYSIPIHERSLWSKLSFTRDLQSNSSRWNFMVRAALTRLNEDDGQILEAAIMDQLEKKVKYPIDDTDYQRSILHAVEVNGEQTRVSVPEDQDEEEPQQTTNQETEMRESLTIQGKLAFIGEKFGYKIWVPRNDRNKVLEVWQPEKNENVLDQIPLNFNEAALTTIENIDLIWFEENAIVRAFEVEHTTSIYGGLLRMSDLLALQRNIDIKLHIVGPEERKDKVLKQIQRPTFQILLRKKLQELCSFISYENVYSLADDKRLEYYQDRIIESIEEFAEE
jgi:hypothetical protein